MKSLRMMALGGAAILAMTGNVLASQSTAQERSETRQLNLEQAQQSAAPAPNVTDAASSLPANAPPAAAPTIRVDASDISLDAIAPVTVTPRVKLSAAGSEPALAPMALNSFSNPPDKVATARVVDSKGITIGAVQKVDIDGGKPSRVEVALLGSNQIISLDARTVSYDEANNMLMASGDGAALAAPRG